MLLSLLSSEKIIKILSSTRVTASSLLVEKRKGKGALNNCICHPSNHHHIFYSQHNSWWEKLECSVSLSFTYLLVSKEHHPYTLASPDMLVNTRRGSALAMAPITTRMGDLLLVTIITIITIINLITIITNHHHLLLQGWEIFCWSISSPSPASSPSSPTTTSRGVEYAVAW